MALTRLESVAVVLSVLLRAGPTGVCHHAQQILQLLPLSARVRPASPPPLIVSPAL